MVLYATHAWKACSETPPDLKFDKDHVNVFNKAGTVDHIKKSYMNFNKP